MCHLGVYASDYPEKESTSQSGSGSSQSGNSFSRDTIYNPGFGGGGSSITGIDGQFDFFNEDENVLVDVFKDVLKDTTDIDLDEIIDELEDISKNKDSSSEQNPLDTNGNSTS